MARISFRESTRFDQEHSEKSHIKYVLATIPLAIVLAVFSVEAYRRPSKPFYNLPAYMTDDVQIQQAADASGSLVPLMDMCYVCLSFSVAWACVAAYFLGFLRARRHLIDRYLQEGKSVLGNLVYEQRGWACEFRYYGYCSYPNHEKGGMIHKRVRIMEPYTRELVPIVTLEGYPFSGQGKDDCAYALLLAQKNQAFETFIGVLSVIWTVLCVGVTVYILHQMKVIDEAEYYAGITDDYDNVDKGWRVFGLFVGLGIGLFAMGGTALCWVARRWWLLHQGSVVEGDLSIHGFDHGVVVSTDSRSHQEPDNYQRMSGSYS